MLTPEKKKFLNMVADALERKDERKWVDSRRFEPVSAASAVVKVTSVLRQQWDSPPDTSDRAFRFFEGLTFFDLYFSSPSPSEAEIDCAISRAEKEHSAFAALRALAAMRTAAKSASLATWQQNWALGLVTEPPKPTGRSKTANLWRDYLIVGQLKELAKLGFSVQRSSASTVEESACDIVSAATQALGDGRAMTYQSVEGIWKRRGHLPTFDAVGQLFESLFETILANRGTL
jgi:hypothetical protein